MEQAESKSGYCPPKNKPFLGRAGRKIYPGGRVEYCAGGPPWDWPYVIFNYHAGADDTAYNKVFVRAAKDCGLTFDPESKRWIAEMPGKPTFDSIDLPVAHVRYECNPETFIKWQEDTIINVFRAMLDSDLWVYVGPTDKYYNRLMDMYHGQLVGASPSEI